MNHVPFSKTIFFIQALIAFKNFISSTKDFNKSIGFRFTRPIEWTPLKQSTI
jgi:hypothetical protein